MNLPKDNMKMAEYFYDEGILQKVYTQLDRQRDRLGVFKVTITLTETFCGLAKTYFEVRPTFLEEVVNIFCDMNGYSTTSSIKCERCCTFSS